MDKRCWLLGLGLVEYAEAFRLQQAVAAARAAGVLPNTLITLQHPPVVTLGRSAHAENLLVPPELLRLEGVAVHDSNRGGDVTYHGPGQLVAYPILALRPLGLGPSEYVHSLERVVIDFLRTFGLEGRRDPRYIGVWVADEKIAAIGVRVSRGITLHGFAINVDPDLSHFRLINPCGITDRGVTSLAKLTGRPLSVPEILPFLVESFARVFDVQMVPRGLADLSALEVPVPAGVQLR